MSDRISIYNTELAKPKLKLSPVMACKVFKEPINKSARSSIKFMGLKNGKFPSAYALPFIREKAEIAPEKARKMKFEESINIIPHFNFFLKYNTGINTRKKVISKYNGNNVYPLYCNVIKADNEKMESNFASVVKL